MPDHIHTNVTVTIGSLALLEANGYSIDGDSLGQILPKWRRLYASSRHVAGRFLLDAVLDQGSLPLRVRVAGDDVPEIRERMQALVDEVSAFSYDVTIDMEGVTETWHADPADMALDGDVWNDDDLGNRYQKINLVIPVYPIPGTAGS